MNAVTAEPQVNPLVVLKEQMEKRTNEFAHALPEHIPVDRFKRVLMTAVQNNPDLVNADRQSLWNSAMRAAQDGLLPDGREGAIVIYNTKEKRDGSEVWIKKAQWMPMVFGILKKVRNSGELAMITARVVYAGDQFRYWIDEKGEHVLYEPADDPDTKVIRRVFALARTKDGESYVEVMSPAEIEKVRSVSRAKDKGPWVDWYDEMAKKTVIRRLSKRLPMSSDLDDLIRRDDGLYNFGEAREGAKVESRRPKLVEALDKIGSEPATKPPRASAVPQVSREASDVGMQTQAGPAPEPPAAVNDADNPEIEIRRDSEDYKRGAEDFRAGAKKCVVAKIRENPVRFAHWKAGYDEAAAG